MMGKQVLMTLLIVLLVSSVAASRSRTKKEVHQGGSALGVKPEELSTLKEQKAGGQPFACDNGATVLAWDQFNDDYCDCEDGADEPGTSACAGRTLSTDHGFYCRNVGHVAKVISSAFVNDGVCDCCDGSDESLTGVCKPQCLEEFKRTMAEKHQQAKKHEQGVMVQRTWQRQSSTELGQKHAELQALEAELAEAETQLQVEEAVEQRRRDELALRGSLGLPREDDAGDDELFTGEAQTGLYGHLSPIDDEDDFPRQADRGSAADDDDEEEDEDEEETDDETDGGDAKQAPVFLEREEVKQLRKRVKELKEGVEKLEKLLDLDFGPNNAFYMLYEKQHHLRAENYNYQVRLYKDAKQDHTDIGKFKELVTADDGTIQMKFTGGQSCWQGPARSLTVDFTCGIETKIVSVEEVSKCTYRMVMEACVACSQRRAQEIQLEIARMEKDVQIASAATDLVL